MSRSSKGLISRLAATMLCVVMVAGLAMSAQAASATIDYDATGTVEVRPIYNGEVEAGGIFHFYQVAVLDQTAKPYYRFAMMPLFATAGVNVNTLTTATLTQQAAETLLSHAKTNNLLPDYTLNRSNGDVQLADLPLGVYLIEMQAGTAPSNRIEADPILVALPSMDAKEGGWLYDVIAWPKLDNNTTDMTVVKVWDDSGFESVRPTSVSVTLYLGGLAQETVVILSEDNNWRHTWIAEYGEVWTVREVVPAGYTDSLRTSDNVFTITNSRRNPVEDTTTSLPVVTTTAPLTTVPVTTTLPEEEEVLTTDPLGDLTTTPPVTTEEPEEEEIEILDPLDAGALQWPIPVLSALGLVFVTGGAMTGNRTKGSEDED